MIIGVESRIGLGFLLLATAFTWGCSSPKVSHTSISGEIKDIEHWRLEWIGTEGSAAIEIPGLYEKSKYTAEEYCTRYVEDVKRKLSQTYGQSFAENYAQIGLIQVELFGEKLSAYVPAPGEDRPSGSITWEDRGGATRAVNEPDGNNRTWFLFGRDAVRKVRLRFFDLGGNPSGDVFIGESYLDKVKPEFVAKVIDEIIRTGRYKGTSAVPISADVEGN